MKVIALTSEYGLTQGGVYEVLEQSAGYYKVRIDNGNIAFRSQTLFEIQESE